MVGQERDDPVNHPTPTAELLDFLRGEDGMPVTAGGPPFRELAAGVTRIEFEQTLRDVDAKLGSLIAAAMAQPGLPARIAGVPESAVISARAAQLAVRSAITSLPGGESAQGQDAEAALGKPTPAS